MTASYKLDRLDREGVIAMLKSPETEALLTRAAHDVANRVRPPRAYKHQTVPVVVNPPHEATYSSASSVTLAHPAGMGIEAKYGILRKAAGGGS